jgi:hypothetical protein
MIHAAQAARREPADLPFIVPERIPDGTRFALIHADEHAKPLVVDTLAQLARAIHFRRDGDGLRMTDERRILRGEVRDMVCVMAENETSGAVRLIGHAWVDGRGFRALEAALAAVVPQTLRGEA